MASRIKDWYRGPDCVICDDTGLHDKTGEHEFCRCPAGVKKQVERPEAAKLANEAMRRIEASAK